MAPTRKGPGEGEGEPGRATGRIGVGTSPDAGCRASRPAAAVSIRASKLPSVVRLQQSLRRPAGFRRPSVIGRGARLSALSPASIIPPAAGLAAGGSTRRPPRLSTKVS